MRLFQGNNITVNFDEILSLIRAAKERIVKTVNTEIIDLYWQIGKEVSERVNDGGWGKSVVEELANHISSCLGTMRGFSAQNIWRMKQFYETYNDKPILSTLLRELSWSNNLLIMSRIKTDEKKLFYLKLAIEEKYSYRELDRQITAMRYERSLIGSLKTRNLPIKSSIREQFLDSYVFDFLHLPEKHPEETFQKAIIANMKGFILEIGKDFTFVGEEFRVQAGKTDFYIDLLFYHRGLSCLVAFELKTTSFKPEYIGKMNFYLEALDRDHRKQNENPSVGVILCADKDDEVVEYALQRNLSPVLVTEYTAKLPDKKLLQNRLRELTDMVM
ncbi:MAG: PDDEXK nuclease domain-containing protein [Treponema sp.]|jgi:predicted nuclease of restriction endonuclease-like (RecB) superfamily|nr:PDDEXK nuclease domain-containing protein [Treponema sp.]